MVASSCIIRLSLIDISCSLHSIVYNLFLSTTISCSNCCYDYLLFIAYDRYLCCASLSLIDLVDRKSSCCLLILIISSLNLSSLRSISLMTCCVLHSTQSTWFTFLTFLRCCSSITLTSNCLLVSLADPTFWFPSIFTSSSLFFMSTMSLVLFWSCSNMINACGLSTASN